MMGSRLRATLVMITGVGVLVSAQTQPEVYGCVVEAAYLNKERKVDKDDLDLECSWPHTPPWGNWGVDSPYDGTHDEDQFPGWKNLDGKYQWNSCTAEYDGCDNLNADNCTTQESEYPNDIAVHAIRWVETVEQTTCDYLNDTVFSEENHYMDLWELDENDWDDFVGTLYFPTLSFEIEGCDPYSCYPASGWVDQSGGSESGISTKFGMELAMRYLYLYGG